MCGQAETWNLTPATMVIAVTVWMSAGGCVGDRVVNPTFDVTMHEARAALDRMATEPTELERPVVVLDGWMNPGFASLHLGPALVRYTGDRRVITATFFGVGSFEASMARVIDKVESAFGPAPAPGAGAGPGERAANETVAVDVVAFSMGGLVAKYAALPADERATLARELGIEADVNRPRLNIARLFTISTPHRGARMAEWVWWDGPARQMRAGSPLIEGLNAYQQRASYTVYPYVRLGDRLVGEAHTAPPGATPWWAPRVGLSLSHMTAFKDPRIVADIVARLRGEQPFTRTPAAPLPD